MCLFNLSDATGAYALIFLLAYLPAVLPDLSRKELVALFLLFQPADAIILEIGQIPNEISYITGETVTSTLGFTFGSLARPMAMFFLLLFFAVRLATSKTAACSTKPGTQGGVSPTAA